MSDRWTVTFCPECGLGVVIDEDGCCATCGATAVGRAVEECFAGPNYLDQEEWSHLPDEETERPVLTDDERRERLAKIREDRLNRTGPDEEEDCFGLKHDSAHIDTGRGRPARMFRTGHIHQWTGRRGRQATWNVLPYCSVCGVSQRAAAHFGWECRGPNPIVQIGPNGVRQTTPTKILESRKEREQIKKTTGLGDDLDCWATSCPECGAQVKINENGCCAGCGCTAVGSCVEKHFGFHHEGSFGS